MEGKELDRHHTPPPKKKEEGEVWEEFVCVKIYHF